MERRSEGDKKIEIDGEWLKFRSNDTYDGVAVASRPFKSANNFPFSEMLAVKGASRPLGPRLRAVYGTLPAAGEISF